MIQILRAIFRKGAFVPTSPCHLPENAEVRLQVDGPLMIPAQVDSEQERAAILQRITRRMQNNPIPASAPRLTRDQLHDRA